jgi:hypothetical protein
LYKARLPFSHASSSYGEPGGRHHHRISCPDGAKAEHEAPGTGGRRRGFDKEITCAENKAEATKAVEAFATEFGAKWPKAVANITSEKETLLAFYDYPAEHWHHLRTTDLIESAFAPVRARDESDERAWLASGRTGDDLQVDGSS